MDHPGGLEEHDSTLGNITWNRVWGPFSTPDYEILKINGKTNIVASSNDGTLDRELPLFFLSEK